MIGVRLLQEHEYKPFFEFINPYCLVAPFGLRWHLPEHKVLVVTTKNYTDCFSHKNFKVRTYENCHARLAIGSEGALLGSWNWSLAHERAPTHREIVVFAGIQELVYEQLQSWFDEMWKKSHRYTKPVKATKLHGVSVND